jgi:hypothetical protein
MVYAWLVLHAREPHFFKTTAVPSRPPPMVLEGSVLGGWLGWFPVSQPRFTVTLVVVRQRQVRAPSSSPRCPYRLLCCDTPLLALFFFPCSVTNTVYTHPQTTDTTNTVFQPQQQHQHYPTLTPTLTPTPQQRAVTRHRTAHPGTSASLPVRASHQAPDEKTARLISPCLLSVVDIEPIVQHPPSLLTWRLYRPLSEASAHQTLASWTPGNRSRQPPNL